MSTINNSSANDEVIQYLKNIETRISKIEEQLDFIQVKPETVELISEEKSKASLEKEDELEFAIGQKWFAKFGIVVLVLGIILFLTFPYENLPIYFPSIFGFIISTGLFSLSFFWQKTLKQISSYLLGSALLLLFFSTLRLTFFGELSVITNITLEVALLLIVFSFNLFISVKRKSIYLTYWILFTGYITAIVSDSSLFIFIFLTLLSALVVYLSIKYNWQSLIFFGTFFTYLTHFIWFINNPILGRPIELVSFPINLIFVLAYSVIYFFGNYLRENDIPQNYLSSINSFLNSFGGLILFFTIAQFNKPYLIQLYYLTAAVVFILLSIAFWNSDKNIPSTYLKKIDINFYAITSNVFLSLSIIHQFNESNIFIALTWQSLIVLITAIWFRSKYIIVANFIIYLVVFITYLILQGEVELVSISYGVVALISARILNWKKDKLDLKTELMRNAYLVCALLIIPYALYHSLPEVYVSFSWIIVAIIYYLFSIFLKNRKYRWMSLLTLIITIIYVLIIGITHENPVYKILSFIVLGIVLLLTSLIYTKKISANKTINE